MATPRVKKEPQRTFAFDLLKPMFKGNLLKQGGFHKAFKDRFFVLYPGFLVYYDTITTWQYDLQRGETLGSRLSAIKLRGGSVAKAKNPPKGAKHAFVVTAPDPANRRNSFMFNAKSNEERYQWMVKIGHAIPGKDKREPKAPETKKEEQPKSKEEKAEDNQQPSAHDAEQDPSVKKIDHIDLGGGVLESTPEHEGSKDESFVDALGPVDSPKSTSSKGSINLSESPEPLNGQDSDPTSPKTESESNPKNKPESNTSETEPSPDKDNCDLSVVSSVSVEVNQDQKGMPPSPPPPSPPPSLQPTESLDVTCVEGVKRDSTLRIVDSSETIIPAMGSPKLSISVANGTTSSSSDSDEDSEDSEGVELPNSPVFSTTPPCSDQAPSCEPSTPLPAPEISVETVEDERQSNSAQSSPQPEKDDNLSPQHTPTCDRRRPSGINAFVEKRGYLYKQGGKHKSWHLRYFILQPGMFTYYKNDPRSKPLGEVKLSRRTKIHYPKKGEKKYSSYQFTIYSPSDWNKRSTYTIAANNEKEMKEWTRAFMAASGILVESTDKAPNGQA